MLKKPLNRGCALEPARYKDHAILVRDDTIRELVVLAVGRKIAAKY
jgi:hypothetical protein